MALGRISGPLLKSNLLRNGVDLAFETDLLYLDVTNRRIGIKTTTPQYPLDVNGIVRITDLEITNNIFNVGNVTIDGNNNTISTTAQEFRLTTADSTVVGNRVLVGDLEINDSFIENTNTDSDLFIRANGTGTVNIEGNTEITGNLHATGNISADGNITIGDEDTDSITVNADIASDLIPDIDGTYNIGSPAKKWNTLYATNVITDTITTDDIEFGDIDLVSTPGNIIYVANNGLDTRTGAHPQDPVATIQKALTLVSTGDTIYLYPGTYQEAFPLNVPAGITIRGHSLRSCTIVPTAGTNDKDAFLMQGECSVEEVTIKDFYYNSINDTGYAFRFANNFRVQSRSPYVRNVTVLTTGSVTSASDPRGYDEGDAGQGIFLDGEVATADSKEAAMLFHAVTFITPGVTALKATNGARIEWLNSFTYFAEKGIHVYDGANGLKGSGKTSLRYDNLTGSAPVAGETIEYYDTDNTTLLASGTIESVDGTKLTIDGKVTGFEIPQDRARKVVTARADAQIDTSIKKYGTGSLLLDGTGDYIEVFDETDFGFGTGNFSIEGWFYLADVTGKKMLFDLRNGSDTDSAICVYFQDTKLRVDEGNTNLIAPNNNYGSTNFYHIALSRTGQTLTLFVNGSSIGQNNSFTSNLGTTKPLTIGAKYDGSTDFYNGRIDDIRIRKGTSYTSNFTAPTTEVSVDGNTVLMLRFNGSDGSQVIEDDATFIQDIRFSGGGTATAFTLVDLTDFGGELRSIGSACVYGNYGIYADGPGVKMYLIGQNLAYIGVGKDQSNDDSLVIQANEVVQLNDANVYYSSVDHKGDFRVGDLFTVNQSTGNVEFTNAEFLFNNNTGVTFSDGSNTTTIDATKVQTGNVRISGNTIDTTSGDLNLDSATGSINFLDDVAIAGNLDVTGNVTVGGNITLGDQASDSLQITAGIASDLLPSQDNTYDIGSASKNWADLHAGKIFVDNIEINDNYIRSTDSQGDLELSANGTGKIIIDDLQFSTNIVSNPTGDIVLEPSTEVVTINSTGALVIPAGDTSQRPGTPSVGMIRYNNQSGVFEGYDGTWINLGGVFDEDRDTYITAELTPGADDDTLRFYAGGSLVADVNPTRFNVARIEVDDIAIHDGTLETITTNQNLDLTTNGTGTISIENFSFNGNRITNNVDGAVTTLRQTGTGYFKIEGTGGFVIPVGDNNERHPNPEVGMMRYNYIADRVEVYDISNSWSSVAGSTGAVSFNDAEEIAIKLALTL